MLSIRRGTFETNSSSVHSFVFANDTPGVPAFEGWQEPTTAIDAFRTPSAAELSKRSAAMRKEMLARAKADGKEPKVLHLFTWIPDAARRCEERVRLGLRTKYGHPYKLYHNDPVETAFHNWKNNCEIAKTMEQKAEMVIMYFAARDCYATRLIEDMGDGHFDYSNGNLERSLGNEFVCYERGRFICREQIIEALMHAAARHGYAIDWGMATPDMLCRVRGWHNGSKWDRWAGVGIVSLLGEYEPWEQYRNYKAWFLDGDGAGVDRLVFDDRCGYVYTPEGDDVRSQIRRAGYKGDFEMDYLRSGLGLGSQMIVGTRYTSTYEHMG